MRTETSAKGAISNGVPLSDGEFIEGRMLVWCVGVRTDPLAEPLGRSMERGWLLADPHCQVPDRPEMFTCEDAIAVPDLDRPGRYTPMTARYAWRHWKVAGRKVAPSVGIGSAVPPLIVTSASASPSAARRPRPTRWGVPLSGPLARAVTRRHHPAARPGNRIRATANRLLDAVLPRQTGQLGLARSLPVPLDTASAESAHVGGDADRHDSPSKGAT
ncbi:hypothetical protein [Streptomyces sp. NPDC058385]|uniref:hypothetical protein n=1 Tax=Streptomyces sp. NPDC058385 TaxID=3346473 RepID=UPI003654710F